MNNASPLVHLNRFCRLVGIPVVFVAYLAFAFWDQVWAPKEIWEQDFIGDLPPKTAPGVLYDGVIAGGSSAAMGLWAESISKQRDERWISLAVGFEGHSREKYWDFIRRNVSPEQRAAVRSVIYSSASFYEAQFYRFWTRASGAFEGRNRIKIKPDRSGFSYALDLLRGKDGATETAPKAVAPSDSGFAAHNPYGDFGFDGFACNFVKYKSPDFDPELAIENLAGAVTFFGELFPNASLTVVVPASYARGLEDHEKLDRFQRNWNSVLDHVRAATGRDFTFLPMGAFPSDDMICFGHNHATASGRAWMTDAVLERAGLLPD